MFELSGRTALVTGAGVGAGSNPEIAVGGRIGFGIAATLARQGARVLVNDVDPERAQAAVDEIHRAGHVATAAPFDITDRAAVDEAFAKLASDVGPIEILVNNAGLGGTKRMTVTPFVNLPPEQWHAPIDVNLFGTLNCVQAALPAMISSHWGRIVFISSEAGRVGLHINVSMYGAGKAASAHFMRHLAHEVGKRRITCNSISVGLIEGSSSKEMEEFEIARMPLDRLGTKDDIGAAVAFLASDEAGWITGQTLPVNGGTYSF